jgi:hypothetical protein
LLLSAVQMWSRRSWIQATFALLNNSLKAQKQQCW